MDCKKQLSFTFDFGHSIKYKYKKGIYKYGSMMGV